jgi:hypothetical protein
VDKEKKKSADYADYANEEMSMPLGAMQKAL